MNLSHSRSSHSKEDQVLPHAREERGKQPQVSENRSDRRHLIDTLLRQLTPSYDFFLNSLLSGAVLGAALLVHSRALMFLGILLAPFLGPVFGTAFSSSAGSTRLMLKSIFSLMVSALFIFGMGALAGAISPLLLDTTPLPQSEWNLLQLVNFLVVGLGAGVGVYRLVRSPRQKPLLASAAMAYGLLPPITTAGFNLTAVPGSDWCASLTAAGMHLIWAMLVCTGIFILLGLPPRTLGGYLLTALIIGGLVAPFIAPYGSQSLVLLVTPTRQITAKAATPLPTTAALMPTASSTPQPSPAATFTNTVPLTPSITPTQTQTPIPTPILARISAPTGGGAYLRDQPDGKILSSILNGNLIEVISEPVRGKNSVIWVQVRTADDFTGWIVQSLLATATPSAGW